MHKYLEQHGSEDMSTDEANDLVQKFMDEYNGQVSYVVTEETAKTADDFLELALDAHDEKSAIKYLKKAIKLDPDNLDVAMTLIEYTEEEPVSYLNKLEELVKTGNRVMEEGGYMSEDNIGNFWGILETRPYMRVRRKYADTLLTSGAFRKGMQEYEEMIGLCENDNLGNRYRLMHLYVFFEDEEKALELCRKYEGDRDSQMVLPLSILYFKKRDLKTALKYLKKLAKINKDTEEFIAAVVEDTIDDLILDMDGIGYRPFTIDELLVEYMENETFFEMMYVYFLWADEQMEKMKKL